MIEAAVQVRGERGFVRERLIPALVLAAFMALLAGEPYTWRELASDPAALPFLAALYLAYAVTVQGLVGRFRWSPRVAMLFGAFAGTVLEGFFHRSFFADEPRVLGVNWITVAIMLLYWGVLTTALAYYAAQRVAPTAAEPPYGRAVWIALALWWAALLALWWANLPPLREPGAIPVALLAAALLAAVAALGRRGGSGRTSAAAGRSRVLDAAVAAYVAIELAVALAVPGAGVRVGMWIVTGVVLGIVGLAMLGQRAATGMTGSDEAVRL